MEKILAQLLTKFENKDTENTRVSIEKTQGENNTVSIEIIKIKKILA